LPIPERELNSTHGNGSPVSPAVGKRASHFADISAGESSGVFASRWDPNPRSATRQRDTDRRRPGIDRSGEADFGLDLGTGSGCLLLAVLSELPNAQGLGVDLSRAALDVAAANAESLGLASRAQFRLGDWGSGLAARFDLIICNPPYIPAGRLPGLAPEVAKFDPKLALAGGPDGLDAYRCLQGELRGFWPRWQGHRRNRRRPGAASVAILIGGGLALLGQHADSQAPPAA